ncbi:hypothetical protein PK28_15120 [Hymenobacter sp. DG25B]|jgi:serine/threonine-protein kinase RsbW|uniref:ATP-binding protein n=1 Tax=Hymenobacter sp. DG25B TaxID=1385664 RepID=UPI000540855C|nr:ATP-binding protein [Hymenobacter sp. DG25B]AIZ64670.1 hypothetical protein PK28_15120 [Hymenobacter sp. DG25B]
MKNAIRISCNRSNLKVVRDFVSGYLVEYGQNAVQVNQIILAIDEVVANLIIHANAEDANQYLDIRLDMHNKTFTIELRDQGISYSPSTYLEPDLLEHIRTGKKGGVGMTLVNRIMDRVEFTHSGNYNICRLYKTLA